MTEFAADALKTSFRDSERLIEVMLSINRSLQVDDVLTASLHGIAQVVGGDYGCFLLHQPPASQLMLTCPYGLADPLLEQLTHITFAPNPATAFTVTEQRNYILSTAGKKVRDILHEHDSAPYLILPLTARTQAVGLLIVAVTAGKILDPQTIDLLTAIGEQTGMALSNARLHIMLAESEKWHRGFMEHSRDGFWEGNLKNEITYVNEAVCRIFEMTREELLLTPADDLFVNPRERKYADWEELVSAGAITSRRAKIRTRAGEIKTLLYTSWLVRDEAAGEIRYQATMRDITEQQRLTDTLSRRNQELNALNTIANILSHPLEIASALEQVCAQIVSIIGLESVALYLMDPTQPRLNLAAHRGVSANMLAQIQHLGLDDPFTRAVAVQAQTFATEDLGAAEFPGIAAPRSAGYLAGIAAPIERQGVAVGAIFAGSQTQARYEQADVDLLLNIGRQIGVALENANLYAQMQRRVEELDGLAQLSAACAATLDAEIISRLAITWTRNLLRVSTCTLRLIVGETVQLRAGYSYRADSSLEPEIAVDEVVRAIIQKQEPYIIADVANDPVVPPWHRQRLQRLRLGSFLALPVATHDTVIGILAVGQPMVHRWLPNEIELLKTIANQIGVAFENAFLFQNVLSEQRKVQAIFDSGLSGLYATDAAGRIQMFNRAAERITGWTWQEVQGRKWDEVLGADAADLSASPLINVALVEKRTAFVREGHYLCTRDGRVIPSAHAVAPLIDEKGNVTGAVGAFWDLTKEHAATQAREEFLMQVAHQLRSPLSAVLGALQLLERPNLSEKRRAEMWAILRGDGERLKQFADQFLGQQAVSQSRLPLRLETLAIVPLVRALTRKFRAYGAARFRISAPMPDLRVLADPERVENVLRNLLDNAVNYSPSGGMITITIKPFKKDQVDIAVSDKGAGIPVAEQSRIFEPFYRVKSTEHRATYGHGLGLAIAREMAREMAGELWVESVEQQGATFHLTLRRFR